MHPPVDPYTPTQIRLMVGGTFQFVTVDHDPEAACVWLARTLVTIAELYPDHFRRGDVTVTIQPVNLTPR